MIIAFDIDGCLIDKEKHPIIANVEMCKTLCKTHKVFLWSGNGWEYAYQIAVQLKITHLIAGVIDKYNTFRPDIAFDDQEIDLAKLNICVS